MSAIHSRLQGWMAKFLSIGRRLMLIKAVLTAIPLHFMQAIKLPSWLIDQIDRARRSFMWKGTNKCLGGHCLVKWTTCCLPKVNGGLGILDLRIQNDALLTRWLWKLMAEPDSTWTSTIMALYGTNGPVALLNNTQTSYGLKEILKLTKLLPSAIAHDGTWCWNTKGVYTSASIYEKLANPGVLCDYSNILWGIKAPPKVKVFGWLLLKDMLLTQSNLQKRNWPTIHACILCNTGVEENAQHLFLHCTYATQSGAYFRPNTISIYIRGLFNYVGFG